MWLFRELFESGNEFSIVRFAKLQPLEPEIIVLEMVTEERIAI
jgi:hypothetical protein